MRWEELADLTRQVQQLPPQRQQTGQQLSEVMVSAHSTLIEGSRVSVPEAFNFLLGTTPDLRVSKSLEGYDMLGDHAQALALALAYADTKQAPTLLFLQELAAVMRSTGRPTHTALGTVDPTRGDLRRGNVFIAGASSFPNAQKVPLLVGSLLDDLGR